MTRVVVVLVGVLGVVLVGVLLGVLVAALVGVRAGLPAGGAGVPLGVVRADGVPEAERVPG